MASEHGNQEGSRTHQKPGRSAGRLAQGLRLLLGLVILSIGLAISVYWMKNKPKSTRRAPQPQAALVEVTQVSPQNRTVIVNAMGTVVPARTVQLACQVSGRIVEVNDNFVPGGHFTVNERILRVEPKDYELALRQRAGDLAKAQCDLKLEAGRQSVALREYELLGTDVQEQDKELLLRNPQLQIAEAAVASAEASVEMAILDLTRTDVVSPFNAAVQSRNVEMGSLVNAGTVLASLIDVDKYWVQVSVSVEDLKWIAIPGATGSKGSRVRVYYESAWGPDVFRTGTVERLLPDLEPQGRMARLLVAVPDPLQIELDSPERHALIIGAYVRVQIEGQELQGIVQVPRTALRDGMNVWVMQADDTLDIRRVNAVWNTNDHVYVDNGLSQGNLLITSDLPTPVQGMTLRTMDPSVPERSEIQPDASDNRGGTHD